MPIVIVFQWKNHRTVEVGRDPMRAFSPALLVRQWQLQQVTQDQVQSGSACLHKVENAQARQSISKDFCVCVCVCSDGISY